MLTLSLCILQQAVVSGIKQTKPFADLNHNWMIAAIQFP